MTNVSKAVSCAISPLSKLLKVVAFSEAVPDRTELNECVCSPKSSGVMIFSSMPVFVTSQTCCADQPRYEYVSARHGLAGRTCVGPAGLISSSPSAPQTTQPVTPFCLSACAKTGPKSLLYTPRTIISGRPGLISGPSKLYIVGKGNCFRTGEVFANVGWYRKANRNRNGEVCGKSSGAREVMGIPSETRKSAEPDFDVDAFDPCYIQQSALSMFRGVLAPCKPSYQVHQKQQ